MDNYKDINQNLATAGQPSENDLQKLAQDGFKCVINIAPQDPRYSLDDEKRSVFKLGMEYIFHPVDFKAPTMENFIAFEKIMAGVAEKKIFIHCAANYRVTAFYGYYAIKHLSWTQSQCDDLIGSVWDISQFPVWEKFCNKLKQHIADMRSIENKIIDLVSEYIIEDEDDNFESIGKDFLRKKLRHFVKSSDQIQFVLPGFPCKSPNIVDKSFSDVPDYGEVLAIQRLDEFCSRINKVYHSGSKVTIISDGTTFSDIVHVDNDTKNLYMKLLRNLTVTENIVWADLSNLVPKQSKAGNDDQVRGELLKLISKGPRSFKNFINSISEDENKSAVHDKLCSYLYHDISIEHFSDGDRDKYLQSIREKAYEMMYRGRALSTGIQHNYPHHIRFSVHQYDNSGPKYTFSLNANNTRALAPWHSVPVRRLDGQFELMPRSIAKKKSLIMVTYKAQNWFYQEVLTPSLQVFDFEIIKGPSFGIRISSPNQLDYRLLSVEFLQKLKEDFGFVLFKNVHFDEYNDLVNLCQPFGNLYEWDFGFVHVIKPEKEPKGFIHSLEKTPLHWDLSMLPLTHEKVVDNENFSASTFMLYCKTPPAKNEGQTTLVDGRTVLKIAGKNKVENWKRTRVTYETKMTYFGGVPRTYPLVFQHPNNNDSIFRYQEASDLELQTFTLSSSEYSDKEFKNLIEDVNNIAYDKRCLVVYEWEEGDLAIIDNNYTLHGRFSMTEQSTSRELWRVQVI